MSDTGQPTPRRVQLPDGTWETFGGATLAEQNQMIADRINHVQMRINRKLIVSNLRSGWAAIKDVGTDWLDGVPPYTVPTGVASLALHQQQIGYLYDHERRLTEWLGSVGDAVMLLIDATDSLLDRVYDEEA